MNCSLFIEEILTLREDLVEEKKKTNMLASQLKTMQVLQSQLKIINTSLDENNSNINSNKNDNNNNKIQSENNELIAKIKLLEIELTNEKKRTFEQSIVIDNLNITEKKLSTDFKHQMSILYENIENSQNIINNLNIQNTELQTQLIIANSTVNSNETNNKLEIEVTSTDEKNNENNSSDEMTAIENIQLQFNEYKINSNSIIQELKQQLIDSQINYEKEKGNHIDTSLRLERMRDE